MTYTTISETVEAYDSMLNDTGALWPIVAGISFTPSDILDALDPIAYKCGWLDWCDAEGIETDDLEDDYTFSRDRM